MSEVKRIARAEIEFDAEGLEVSEDYLLGDLDGTLFTYIEAVKTECKPVAAFGILKRHLDHAVEVIEREGLRYLVEPWTEDRVQLYLYGDAYLGEVIATLGSLPKETSKTFRIWARGKLFGYSDHDIKEYLEERSLVNASPPGGNGTATSASRSGSNQHPCLGSHPSGREERCFPYSR